MMFLHQVCAHEVMGGHSESAHGGNSAVPPMGKIGMSEKVLSDFITGA